MSFGSTLKKIKEQFGPCRIDFVDGEQLTVLEVLEVSEAVVELRCPSSEGPVRRAEYKVTRKIGDIKSVSNY